MTRHLSLLLIVLAAAACSAADEDGTPIKTGKGSRARPDSTEDTSGEQTNTTGTGDDRLPGTPPGGSTTDPDGGTTPTPTPGADRDNDGVPDDVDCDPSNATNPGTKALDDNLATDKGLFTVAAGFAQSWTYNNALLQNRISDVSDLELFNKDAQIGNVIVEVRAASTEINNTAGTLLRQMFITLGTVLDVNGVLTTVGCGVEVVGGEAHTQKTTIAKLSGSPGAINVNPLQRVDRAALQVNEQFTMKATLINGSLTCEVTQAAKTTATANVGPITGSVGLLTRQTKALFKNMRICKLK